MTGLRAFREAFLSADVQSPDDWQDFDGRQTRYDLLWSLYENTAYRSIHSWAAAYKSTFGLYKYARNLYNPAYRLGEFWKTHIWGGALDLDQARAGALPIVARYEPLRKAIAQIWTWSNWTIKKDVCTLWGSVLGDVAIKVVDDTDRHKTYLELVHPATLADVQLDPFGHVKAYTIQETRAHPNNANQEVTYTETAERGAGEEVIFRTYLNNQPYPWNGDSRRVGRALRLYPPRHRPAQQRRPRLGLVRAPPRPGQDPRGRRPGLPPHRPDPDHRQGPLALHRLRQGPQSPTSRPAETAPTISPSRAERRC